MENLLFWFLKVKERENSEDGSIHSTLKQEKVEELEESALKGMKKKVKEKKLITLSFYKVIQLYIDHLRRQRINSVKMFIQHIYEDEGHFLALRKNLKNSSSKFL